VMPSGISTVVLVYESLKRCARASRRFQPGGDAAMSRQQTSVCGRITLRQDVATDSEVRPESPEGESESRR
jgi:hypothetical protein